MLTASQVRAARAGLRWDRAELSRVSGVSDWRLRCIEDEARIGDVAMGAVQAVRTAFEEAGVVFLDGAGLKLPS
tara:strand:+ start:153 stop:374 length:222 start_codon:yes stop_codon:yes gene_type:complete